MSDTQSWNDLAGLNKEQEQGNNLLILDSNNIAYRWLKRANYNNFEDEFMATIKSLAKSYKAQRIICCFDFGKSYYRKNLYDKYKANRVKPIDPEEAKHHDEFFDCLNRVTEQMPLEYYKFRGVEADDIIAFIVENLTNKYDHTWIISSDRDLYQLLDDNISIFNLYSRKEITIDSLLEDNITPEEYMLAKIIQGDPGDNIKGIAGIGEKRSHALAVEFKKLPTLILALPIKRKAKYIQNLNSGKDILLLNEQLINLKKYHEKAITAGKEGIDSLKHLKNMIIKEIT